MNDFTPILTFLGPIVVAVIMAIPGIKALRGQREERDALRQKTEDEITERVLLRARSEIAELSQKITEMKVTIEQLEKENVALRLQNGQLRQEIKLLKDKYNGEC